MDISKSLARTLRQASPGAVAFYIAITSFGVYFCMYAFRKPFTAAGFEGQHFLNVSYKVWLVTAQVLGYMLSKFYGIKFISSISRNKRALTIACLIFFAWMALLLFALTPAPYNMVFLFINGFPLGMVWGLVFSYLEGRRLTEAMGAVLASSFIFSSGVVKSVGKYLLQEEGISESWMPFVAGALFIIPMLLFTWLLKQVPPPSGEDIRLRTERKPMDAAARRQFLALYLPGLVIIVVTYVFLTILRDFRDNFANELWTELGYGQQPSVFTKTEVPVSIIVLLSMALLILVRSNIKAFLINHAVIVFGYVVCIAGTYLFVRQHIGAVPWMTLTGTGLYMAYVPFNALYFERMIATFKIRGNVGFVMYIADAFGYLGSVLVLFLKEFSGIQLSWTRFFVHTVYIVSVIGIAGTIIAAFYFRKKHDAMKNPVTVLYAA